jgi:amidase
VGILDNAGAINAMLRAIPAIACAALWNVAGNPAAAVPRGLGDDGLPLAVQLVGRPHEETTLLSLSAQLEAARPWPLLAG